MPKKLNLTDFIRLDETPLVYHATIRDFEDRDLSPEYGEFGIHAGSLDQAHDVITPNNWDGKYLKKNTGQFTDQARMFKFDTDDNKKLRLPDLVEWFPNDIYEELKKLGFIDLKTPRPEDVELSYDCAFVAPNDKCCAAPPRKCYRDLRQKLLSLGYDGIIYLNRHEGLDDQDRSKWNNKTSAVDYKQTSDEEFKELFPSAHDSYILFDPYGNIHKRS